MCPDTKALLAYVKSELFFAAICYYIKINPKPITAMAKKIAEQLIDTLVKSGVERIYAVLIAIEESSTIRITAIRSSTISTAST